MATRILKLEEEDAELIEKLIRNIHSKLRDNPNHPVYAPYLMAAHRLNEQFVEGLPTERQYVYALSDAKEAFETAEEKNKAKKRQRRERKLEQAGIKASVETVEAVEPLAEPKRTKVRKAAKPKNKAVASKAAPTPRKTAPKGPCKVHNNSGARSPRSDCRGCWAYYKELHPDRYKDAWNKFNAK